MGILIRKKNGESFLDKISRTKVIKKWDQTRVGYFFFFNSLPILNQVNKFLPTWITLFFYARITNRLSLFDFFLLSLFIYL